jgi:PAS domain S-box-containing protein
MNKHRQLLNAVLDASLDGLIALSESAEKPYATASYAALFPGWQQLRYHEPLNVVRDFFSQYIVDIETLVDLVDEVRRTRELREGRVRRHDGRILHVTGRVITTPDGADVEVWVYRDITAQCRQDEQLQWRLQLVTAVLNASGDAVFALVEGLKEPLTNAGYSSFFPDWKKALRYGQPLEELEAFFSRYLVNWKAHVDLVAKIRQTGQRHQTINYHRDGRIIHVSGEMLNAEFIRGGRLEIYTLTDITEEVRGRRSMRAMQLTVDNLSEPVAWCNVKGKITYVNQAACTALGYGKPSEIVGKSVRRFYRMPQCGDDGSDTWKDALAKLCKAAHSKFEHAILVKKDGSRLPYTILIDYIRQGNEAFLAMCFHDLSEQIQRIEAERAAEAKTKFLAKMSHEIRTPLNSIIGLTEILMRKITTQDFYHELYEFISIIQQSGMSLLAIINDILDFSKIESGSLQLSESKYSFASLLNDVINIANVQIVEHKTINFIVHVDVDIPHELFGDEARVRQIFVNLLSNAVKYTVSGYIMLDVRVSERNDDGIALALTMKDTGIGIKEEDREAIFSEFKRVDSGFNQKTEGTGLGLAIVRSLCRLMHGDIAMRSVYGSGSTFTATIRQQAASSTKLAAVADPGNKRVLLFRDEAARHASVVAALRELGLPEPKTAGTLREFSEAFASGVYDYAFTASRHVREYFRSGESSDLETCREKSPRTKLVVMATLGDVTDIPGASGMTLPVYCVPLANILNGGRSSEARVREANGLPDFSAPTATVLVVDDVPTNLRVAKEFLEFYGIAAEICTGGADAPAMVEGKRYDLIFMDHMMPGVDGLEAVQMIRRLGGGDGYFRNVPIVALTANAVVGQKEMFLENGFNDFLPKPIEAKMLDAILKKWLPPEKRQPAGAVAHNAPTDAPHDGPQARHRRDAHNAPVVQPSLAADFDVEKGIRNVGGRKAAYAAVLAVFRRDGETLVPKLREALAARDTVAYAAAAHALKGALRTIGAERLADSAMRLEKAAASGDAVVPEKETRPFLDELQTLIGAFDHIIPGLTAGEDGDDDGTSATNGALLPILAVLKNALDAGDIRTVDDLLAQCRDMELTAGGRTLIDELTMLVMDFEFEAAAAKIGSVDLGVSTRE